MKVGFSVLSCLFLSLAACESRLEKMKRVALEKLEAEEFLLEAFPVDSLDLQGQSKVEVKSVEFSGSLFVLPQDAEVQIDGKKLFMKMPSFKVSIHEVVMSDLNGALSVEYGESYFDKAIYLEGVSRDLITSAKTDEEVRDGVAILGAKTMIRAVGQGPLLKVKGWGYKGLLWGGVIESQVMRLEIETEHGATFLMLLQRAEEDNHEEAMSFLRSLKISSRAGD